MKFCWFYEFLFYDVYFEFSSLNASNSFYSTKKHHIYDDFLSELHLFFFFFFALFDFLFSLLSSTKNEHILDFNAKDSTIATLSASSLISTTTNWFESSYYFHLVKQLLKSNISLSLQICSHVSSVLISYIKPSVSVNNALSCCHMYF